MKHQKVKQLVAQAYQNTQQEFAKWIWNQHLPVVAKKAGEFAKQFDADPDLAVAGAWLHDFGDAFINRHHLDFEKINQTKIIEILKKADYSTQQIDTILIQVIGPHSCKNHNLPTLLEGKVLATADAWAHLMTDFYLQMCFLNIPQGKSYLEWMKWAQQKIERDYANKIFFEEVRVEVLERYQLLKKLINN